MSDSNGHVTRQELLVALAAVRDNAQQQLTDNGQRKVVLPAQEITLPPSVVHNHVASPVVNVEAPHVSVVNEVAAPQVHNHLPALQVDVAPADMAGVAQAVGVLVSAMGQLGQQQARTNEALVEMLALLRQQKAPVYQVPPAPAPVIRERRRRPAQAVVKHSDGTQSTITVSEE